jgi:PAS domain S-box-containing protein
LYCKNGSHLYSSRGTIVCELKLIALPFFITIGAISIKKVLASMTMNDSMDGQANALTMAEKLFVGGGELGTLLRNSFGDALRSHNWSQTSLGGVETWSDDLKTAVQILLTELDRASPPEKTQLDSDLLEDSSAEAALHQANQLNAFRVKLAEALRPLTDASEIQAIAANILGESLGANRVIYIEVVSGGEYVIVHRNYTNGVAELSGRYRLEDYRRNLSQDHQAGRTQIITDIPNHPSYTDAQKTRYREIDIAAHIDVPLIKNNQFVALLAVQQSTPRQWTETEVKLVEETAERTWATVERARAEAALRSSEAKYRMLFESIDEGYFIADVIFDADDRPIDVFYLEANPAVKRITGLDLAGRSLREIDPNYESAWWEAYGRVVQTGIAERQELYTEPLDSWFSFYTFKIGDASSRRVGCVFQDISQRKRTEQALRDSEQRYRTLFDLIDEAFCVCELMVDETGEPYDHRVLEINPAFEIQTGLQQVTGKAASELIPTLEPFFFEIYARVVRTGESTRFESYLQELDSWFDVYVAPLNVFHRQQFAVLFRNITEQKRASLNAQLLATVRDDLAEITEVGDLVQMVGDRLKSYLNISSCAFVEINERADEALIHAHWHQSHVPNLVGVYALPQFVSEEFLHTAQAGQPIVVRNVATDPRIVAPDKYAALSIGAELNIPLIRDGEWKFSLTVFHPVPYNWRDDEIALMQELASRIWTKLERARAEAVLRESEQRFRLMADAVPQIVWITDTEGRVEFFNKQWSNYTGVPYEPTTAAEVAANFVHPEDGDRTIAAFNEARHQGSVFSVEHRIRSFSGTYRWFLVRAEPYRDSQTGEIIRWFGASIDIHERKQVEDALRQSEARFRRIFECEMVPMGIYTSAGGIVEANNSLLNLIGYTRQELETGQISWQALTPPEYQALDEIAVNEVATRGVSTPYEKVYIHKDGRRIPILIGAALLLEDASSGVFFAIDLSERKQAEAALQEQSQLMQLILTNIGDGLIMANRQGEFVLFNQAAERMFGRLTNERAPEEWSRTYGLYLPDGQTLFPERQLPLYRAMQGEYATDVEVFVRRNPTDAGRWLGISGFPVRDGRGDITGGVITCRDVSERKRILQQEQAAREEAQRANRIKDEFLAVLSHELRSPLNPILGWTRLLRSGKLDAVRQREALATIERNAKLQTQLIEDLLDISRIMQGKMSLTITPVSLTFVISAAVETVRLAAEAKNIQIVLDFPPYVALVNGDAARLQQVVWNLLTNAVKFTPNNGQVTVELRQLDQLAQIRVIDTGKGINPLFLPHVFEYFRQEDGSTTRKFGGLGLGLAIARQIVEMHGGTVWAESQGEEQGATFIVQLPTMKQTASLGSDPITTQTDAGLPLEGIQILLVDDEPDTREFQAFLLSQSGAIVTAVASGLEALLALEKSLPDVLVSDIGMAQMDGYMLMQQIRSRPPDRGGTIPAIALTAYAAEIDRTQALQVGFQTHITKPVELEVLVRAILLSLGRA